MRAVFCLRLSCNILDYLYNSDYYAIDMNEHHLNLLKELTKDNTLSQRDLSGRLGLSLGKVNYILKALLDKGLLKAEKFKNSKHKLAYIYHLTPKGLAAKFELSSNFLQRKIDEYDALKLEIEELKEELKAEGGRLDSSLFPS